GVIRLRDPATPNGPPVDALFDVPVRSAAPARAAAPRPRSASPEPPSGPSGVPTEAEQRRPRSTRRPKIERAPEPPLAEPPSPHQPWEPVLAGMEEVGTGLLDRLDALQRVAASAPGGALLVVAGPGTGKTRTLTHRIAYLCAEMGVAPRE